MMIIEIFLKCLQEKAKLILKMYSNVALYRCIVSFKYFTMTHTQCNEND